MVADVDETPTFAVRAVVWVQNVSVSESQSGKTGNSESGHCTCASV